MKWNVLASVVALTACAACAPPANDESIKRIADLESKVTALQQRDADVRLKAKIVSNRIFDSPLDRFFGEAEFWEDTYDSGQADCSRRCIENLQAERKACPTSPDPAACFAQAAQRASECHSRCAMSFPPPIP
jgi:hypothetical protein